MNINLIIDILKETITNKYFLYTIITIIILTIYRSTKNYKIYYFDCKMLGQNPKPKGFIINTIIDIIILIIITDIAFIGYTAYNKNNIINTKKSYIEDQKIEKQELITAETKYKIIKVKKINKNKDNKYKKRVLFKELINNSNKQGKKEIIKIKNFKVKKNNEKEKLRLKKELLQAIEEVK